MLQDPVLASDIVEGLPVLLPLLLLHGRLAGPARYTAAGRSGCGGKAQTDPSDEPGRKAWRIFMLVAGLDRSRAATHRKDRHRKASHVGSSEGHSNMVLAYVFGCAALMCDDSRECLAKQALQARGWAQICAEPVAAPHKIQDSVHR